MDRMPSRALLESALHEIFRLQDAQGAVANAELLSVDTGTSMNEDYVCYSAVFGLPAGIVAAQGTYRVSRSNGESWPLFVAPIRPDTKGRARLEALFHYRTTECASSSTAE